ncbi:seryl-tRNA synthetase [Chytridiales sp. JEL 0842]|nr:seryl-tRNA synthetase [Chytridiales sp. JEL 0842]
MDFQMINKTNKVAMDSKSATDSKSFSTSRSSLYPQNSSPAKPASTKQTTNTSASATIARQFQPLLNFRYFKENADNIAQNIQNRAMPNVDIYKIVRMYDNLISEEFKLSELRRRRNQIADDIASITKRLKSLKKEQKEEAARKMKALVEEGKELKKLVQVEESKVSNLQAELYEEARHIPNDAAPNVPIGDESQATVLETVGVPLVETSFPLKDHVELALLHDLADFDRASKISGTGFYYLKNAGTLLEMALSRYAIDICMQRGFVPVAVPDLIRHEVLEGCGFNPRSDDPQTYFVSTSMDTNPPSETPTKFDPKRLVLSATAEFPLAGMYANEVLPRAHLPLKMVGIGRAFRAEGLAGSINRGLYRVHQFQKVEMFAISSPLQSDPLLQEFREIQKEIFAGLELCFRTLNMPTEELGAPAYQKLDMEAWMPGRGVWGEISSASNCTDYQSRRLNIRFLNSQEGEGQGMEFVHTVNGTAAAIPRLIIALLETHQREDGSVGIPKNLRRYLFGEGVDALKLPKGVQLPI